MEIKDIKKLNLKIDIDKIKVDSTSVIEHAFFEDKSSKDYRNDSVDFMITNKIDFHSTCNSNYNIATRFIQLLCPSCNALMKHISGSGSGEHSTVFYSCTHCKTEASITIPHEGIRFQFARNIQFLKDFYQADFYQAKEQSSPRNRLEE